MRVVMARADAPPERMLAPQPVWPLPIVNIRDDEAVEKAQRFMDEFVRNTVRADRRPEYDVVVRDGDPVEALIDEVRQVHAGLLVMGRRGLGGFASLMLGSISDKCAAHAPCPVMVVAGDPVDRTTTVVVGVDGSPGSTEAVEWAAQQAVDLAARLHVVGAWKAPIVVADSVSSTLNLLNEGVEVYAADARKAVASAVRRSEARFPSLDVSGDVVQGDASVVLIEAAIQADPAVLVVGTRGRGGFTSLLLGSVAHQCLHHAKTPVVVVRPWTQD
jgi:nucleotide-binding universal stress UspA family protein